MTKPKSLGQIARDEYAHIYGFPPWSRLTPDARCAFERMAAAVARAARQRKEEKK